MTSSDGPSVLAIGTRPGRLDVRVAGAIVLGVVGSIVYAGVTVDVAGIPSSTIGIITMLAAGLWFVVEVVQIVVASRTQRGEHADGSGGQRHGSPGTDDV